MMLPDTASLRKQSSQPLLTLKSAAKSACVFAVKALPWGGRRAVLDALLDGFDRRDIFVEIGQQLRVENLTIKGANGMLRGSIEDMGAGRIGGDVGLLGRYAAEGSFALEVVRLFQEFFKDRGGSFVDIGANIGAVTIPVAQNPRVQCLSFEPVPRNFAHLTHNVQTNCEHGNVTLHQLALFDRKAELNMAISPGNSGDHQLRPDSKGADKSDRRLIPVPADRLDNVLDLRVLQQPIAIKMDTQGAEPGIFAGGGEIIAAAELMSVEFWPVAMRRIGGDVELELQLLQAHFRKGKITRGDVNEIGEWEPIDSVVQQLRGYWNDSNIGGRYFDVTVRK